MKGKKTDPEFISNFISGCLSEGKVTQEKIIEAAKLEISSIDNKIKEVELLKKRRSKLLDVIYAFGKPDKLKEDSNKLLFLNIKYVKISIFICRTIKKETLTLRDLKYTDFELNDILECVDQLIEMNIIKEVNGYLIVGDLFEEYIKFIMCEG